MTTATLHRNRVQRLLLASLVAIAATLLPLSPAPTFTAQAAPNVQPDVVLDLPPLAPDVLANARQVYQNGLAQGNDPNRFILIGDSNNEKPQFLRAFSYGNYNLGPYAYLQPVIDAYQATGSFGAHYPSSEHGMTLNMLMDPMFVNPTVCPDAANLLDCALQQFKPSVAIIYMGTYDTCHTPFDVYRENFNAAMQLLTARGVIAVLTTYTVALEGGCWVSTPAYTGVIRDMAYQYRMPLIDLPAYTDALPSQGLETDGWHLSYADDYHTSFAGGEDLYGNTQRELLTLQMLYLLRRGVMGL